MLLELYVLCDACLRKIVAIKWIYYMFFANRWYHNLNFHFQAVVLHNRQLTIALGLHSGYCNLCNHYALENSHSTCFLRSGDEPASSTIAKRSRKMCGLLLNNVKLASDLMTFF